jgi:hypothetical protein
MVNANGMVQSILSIIMVCAWLIAQTILCLTQQLRNVMIAELNVLYVEQSPQTAQSVILDISSSDSQ